MLTAREIRKSFIEFFLSKGHTFVPSSPIVPHGDETLLFANAGMNQFKDIFLGLRAPEVSRAVNSQKCLRVSGKHNDLEEVGMDTYHHTFFEMLGNWSFNDYFKAEAISWAWELLTKVWGINPDQLYASIFAGDEKDGIPRDDEAAQLWTKLTPIPPERVMAFGKKENFWEMGETGPCGPCSEIHIDLGPDRCDKKGVPGHTCRVNGDCARFIELWNLVFIQYNRQTSGNLVPLSAKYIDTGAGLERVVRVLQDKKSNYDTDLFMPIIQATAKMSGHKYTSQLGNKTDNAFRVIADHTRTLVFAITDGATPSNEGRGYVIRRILRRAARYGRELDLHEPFLYKLVPVVVECLGEAFPEIRERAEYVATVIQSEEAGFGRTLDRGLEIFNTAASRAAETKTKTLSGDDAFQLYDTFGFPPDLTQLLAREKGLSVDVERFDELMKEQKERARAAQKTDSMLAGLADSDLPATEDLHKYRTDRCDAKILGWIDSAGFKKQGTIPTKVEIGLVLDRTCFYAESGGQVGDTGVISAGRAWRGRPALASRGHLGLASPAVSVRRRQRARARCPRHRPLRRRGNDEGRPLRDPSRQDRRGFAPRRPERHRRGQSRPQRHEEESHRHAPAPVGTPAGARQIGRPAGQLRRTRLPAVRLHVSEGPDGRGACQGRAARPREDRGGPAGRMDGPAARRGREARRDGPVRREVRQRGPRRVRRRLGRRTTSATRSAGSSAAARTWTGSASSAASRSSRRRASRRASAESRL